MLTRGALDRGAKLTPATRSPNPNLNLTFDLILIDGRGILMDYLCANFGDSFCRFGFSLMRTDRQTDRITEADERYSLGQLYDVTSLT